MASPSNVKIHREIKIPLRDGVHVAATLYYSEPLETRRPCVFTLTPYTADSIHSRAVYFASHGLRFLSIDVRGRGDSEGTFRPYLQEANDGYDVVEWIAKQSYCSGKVAMCGGSYNGYGQWAAAKEHPPHLLTIVPTASCFCGVDFPMRNNIFYPFVLQWLTLTSGRTSKQNLISDQSYWSSAFSIWHRSGRPFRDLDKQLGTSSSTFQEWLDHPEPDGYWDAYNPSDEQYAQIRIPILTITGSYDDDQTGALAHYKAHVKAVPADVANRHHLVIGPWDHAGTRTPTHEFGGLTFGPQSLIDLQQLHLEWYKWTLSDGAKPTFLVKRVAYYVMGAERWRYVDNLHEVTSHHVPYYLDSKGGANHLFSSGSLKLTRGSGPPDGYTYDPRDVSGDEVEAESHADGSSLTDQSLVLGLSGRLLVYHTDPFSQDTEVSGWFRLCAWISIDCPDTDLYAIVYEICSDGTSIRLSTDALRARYREGLRSPSLIEVSTPLQYTFDRFTFVSRLVKRGHRLRLVIAPIGRLVDATFTQKNYNGGDVVAEESSAEGSPVTVRLYHNEEHSSALFVPIGQTTDSP